MLLTSFFLLALLGEPDATPAAAPEVSPAVSAAPAASVSPAASVPKSATVNPKPTGTPKAPLKEIGRVRAITPFCRAFITHFNAATHPILDSDAQISYIGFQLTNIEPDFQAFAGELKVYDDRVKLAAYAQRVLTLVPAAQAEINELRRSATLTSDPEKQREARELAKQLQKGLDRQRQVAIDTQGVVHALIDVATSTYKTQVREGLAGGYDQYVATTPKDWRDVRSYLHFQDQVDRIGDAEGSAATLADSLVQSC